MKISLRFLFAFCLTVGLGGAAAFAASPNIEGTPVPTQPKPDFSTMKFLIGTWECSDMSSRRPGPFQTTEVYSMDPSGYWMLRESTIHTASWIPREVRNETKFTWTARRSDGCASRPETGAGTQFRPRRCRWRLIRATRMSSRVKHRILHRSRLRFSPR